MKIIVAFKTPDAVETALMWLSREKQEEAREKLERWVRYGEHVSLEFDLEEMTARVLEQR